MSTPRTIFFCLSILIYFGGYSQSIDSTNTFKKRKQILWVSTSALYASTLYGLNTLWYEEYDRSSFHFFNDNSQWLGVDKLGHTYSAYVAATTGIKTFEWAGYNKKQSAFIGGSIGWVFLTTVEVFDGFSDEWGFSTGDMIANTIGSSIAIGQYLIWDKQIMRLKFSYSPSDLREYRPEVLGETEVQGFLKDYNGQTYWASFNLNYLHGGIEPKWLNLAIGYGGDGMIYSNSDYISSNGEVFEQKRQYYLSLDIDFERIPSNKAWVRSILTALNYFKLPFPALMLEEGGGGVQFMPIHF